MMYSMVARPCSARANDWLRRTVHVLVGRPQIHPTAQRERWDRVSVPGYRPWHSARAGVGSPPVGGILYPLAVLAALVLGAFGVGAWLPVGHVATRTKRLPAQPAVVWGLIHEPVRNQ